jgi:hypothetical protein
MNEKDTRRNWGSRGPGLPASLFRRNDMSAPFTRLTESSRRVDRKTMSSAVIVRVRQMMNPRCVEFREGQSQSDSSRAQNAPGLASSPFSAVRERHTERGS